MFYGIADPLTYILGTIVIVLLPGPNSLYVLSVASQSGVRAGYLGACGIFFGDTILMVLSAMGMASLLKTTPALFMVVKYAGAAYLCWMGINLLHSAWRLARTEGTIAISAPPAPLDPTRPFRTALLISLLNPKAILFFVSFFIQFARFLLSLEVLLPFLFILCFELDSSSHHLELLLNSVNFFQWLFTLFESSDRW